MCSFSNIWAIIHLCEYFAQLDKTTHFLCIPAIGIKFVGWWYVGLSRLRTRCIGLCVCVCVFVCVCPNVAWHPCALFNKQRVCVCVCVCVVRLWVAALCPSWSAARHLAVIVYSAILTVKKLQDNISGSPTRPTVRRSFPGRAGRVCVCVCRQRPGSRGFGVEQEEDIGSTNESTKELHKKTKGLFTHELCLNSAGRAPLFC